MYPTVCTIQTLSPGTLHCAPCCIACVEPLYGAHSLIYDLPLRLPFIHLGENGVPLPRTHNDLAGTVVDLGTLSSPWHCLNHNRLTKTHNSNNTGVLTITTMLQCYIPEMLTRFHFLVFVLFKNNILCLATFHFCAIR